MIGTRATADPYEEPDERPRPSPAGLDIPAPDSDNPPASVGEAHVRVVDP